MHIAAYLGAANVILAGHGCGSLGGRSSYKEYYKELKPSQETHEDNYVCLGQIEQHSIDTANAIENHYKARVHSINPFLNFNLDGRSFESLSRPLDDSHLSAYPIKRMEQFGTPPKKWTAKVR